MMCCNENSFDCKIQTQTNLASAPQDSFDTYVMEVFQLSVSINGTGI